MIKQILFIVIFSQTANAAPLTPVRKETQADRIEKRLIRVEDALNRALKVVEASARNALKRENMISEYNRCHRKCPQWNDSMGENESRELRECHDKCQLPDSFLAE